MGTNQTRDYDGAVNMVEAGDIQAGDIQGGEGIRWKLDSRWQALTEILESMKLPAQDVQPDYVRENQVKVRLPENCGPELRCV